MPTDCNNCGACCRSMRTPPHLVLYVDGDLRPVPNDECDYDRIMSAPQEARDSFVEQLYGDADADAPCCWLDADGRCRHYEHRPMMCRDFEVGSRECLDIREFYGIND